MRRCSLLSEAEGRRLSRPPRPASPPSTLRTWLLETEPGKLSPRDRTWFYCSPRSSFSSDSRLSCLRSEKQSVRVDSSCTSVLFFFSFSHFSSTSLRWSKQRGWEMLLLTDISNNSPYSSTHLKNLPPKNCTPIIENISQNTRQTRSTLNILGIAYINAFTTI